MYTKDSITPENLGQYWPRKKRVSAKKKVLEFFILGIFLFFVFVYFILPTTCQEVCVQDQQGREERDTRDRSNKRVKREDSNEEPVILTKAQKQQLALERRAAQVAEMQSNNNDTEKKEGDRDRRDRDTDRRDRNGGDEDRVKEREMEKRKARAEDKEKEAIKAQYLGLNKEKKKVIKLSEKSKFVFNWDTSEDTSRDINPLYDNKPVWRATKTNEKENDDKSPAHWSEKPLEKMTNRDWRIFREDHNITTKGGSIPNPIRNWNESNLPQELLNTINISGYKAPTAIQMQAIPIGLQGRDVIGVAETGSGKTASFVLPMLAYISKLPKMTPDMESDGPYAIVMAPARELVQQIAQEIMRFAEPMSIRAVSLVGGQPIEEQECMLRKGCEIVVATPGRLNDCLDRRFLVLNQCTYVVLDEADRMIGFEDQVNTILGAMPNVYLKSENPEEAARQENESAAGVCRYRITSMYTATMDTSAERIAKKYLRRPAYVTVGKAGKTSHNIKHKIELVSSENEKKRKLEYLLENGPPPPIIVFTNQKKSCDAISKHLERLGYCCAALHSGRTQSQRELAIQGFRQGQYDILVSTSVAGRGIHVERVSHVINYEMPKTIEDFTHRIGRTGRAGNSGRATSLLAHNDTDIMYDLRKMLENTNNAVPKELADHPASQSKHGSVLQPKIYGK